MAILEPLIFPKHQADFSKAEDRDHRLSPLSSPSWANTQPFSPLSHSGFTL